ncbi:MAG: GNAT family N-acetyltransferase [Candidatus Thorarchaeota archaeon]|jgi:ribosomal protein S18 acetylase RimI-like enzyme
MVEITINKFKDVNIPELASFIFEATKDTVFHREDRTRESLEEAFKRRVNNENEVVLVAKTGEKIVGAMRVVVGFPEMSFAANWHPRIHHDDSREEIALELIQFCKEYVKENGFKRFEMNLGPIRQEHAEVYKEYKSWCEKSGLYRATEEMFMEVNLQNQQLKSAQSSLPEGFRFESIDNVTNDDIESSVFESFANGSDRLFADLTSSQQRVVFNLWFNRSRPFHRSTLLVLKDGEVIGFNVVRVNDDSAHIGPVGVIPKCQRQGIMKAVLHESFNRLNEDGIKIAHLETDKSNDAAISLYTKFGFKEQHTMQYFAWRVD